MIYTYVAAALVAGAVAATGAWQVQSWRYDARIAELQQQHAGAVAAAQAQALSAERKITGRYQGALNDARKRSIALQGAADGARDELDRLRDEARAAIARARSASACTASPEPATARDDVLGACTATIEALGRELVELAKDADRHVDDIKTLIQAWPKE